MTLPKTALLILTLLLSPSLSAQWSLLSHQSPHAIHSQPRENQELRLFRQGEGLQLLLKMGAHGPSVGDKVTLEVDGRAVAVAVARPSPDHADGHRLELTGADRVKVINAMIGGLELRLGYGGGGPRFSLLGFTSAFNDLLIADALGRIDHEWLMEQGRERELLCYYVANVTVRAMLHRLEGVEFFQSVHALPATGMELLDSAGLQAVRQVYEMDAAKLPRDPRGDKYGLFRACLERAVSAAH